MKKYIWVSFAAMVVLAAFLLKEMAAKTSSRSVSSSVSQLFDTEGDVISTPDTNLFRRNEEKAKHATPSDRIGLNRVHR